VRPNEKIIAILGERVDFCKKAKFFGKFLKKNQKNATFFKLGIEM